MVIILRSSSRLSASCLNASAFCARASCLSWWMRSRVPWRPLARLVSCERLPSLSKPLSPRLIVPLLWSSRTIAWFLATASTMNFSQSWSDMKLARRAKSVIRIVTYTWESCWTSLMSTIFLRGWRYFSRPGVFSTKSSIGLTLSPRLSGSKSSSSSCSSCASSGNTSDVMLRATRSPSTALRWGTVECPTSVAMRCCLSFSGSKSTSSCFCEGSGTEIEPRRSCDASVCSCCCALSRDRSPLLTSRMSWRSVRWKMRCIAHA
mmetsp:Transcript_79890/g.120062  ORF Transcript_79890/g.120062 Transcript_79890/m.120062 type:complete len:263 (+) Transcript_79890:387-1175(+)